VLIAARLKTEGQDIRLDSGDRQAWFLAGRESLKLALAAGCRFSVLSLSPESTVSLQGARYPLVEYPLGFGVGRGVSNEVSAPPLRVDVARGLVVVIAE
ncbi:MAG TPA: hypothetical protein VF171_03965, partial [Trueperaceae bacterium]